MNFEIGKCKVGEGQRPFIIAEVGSCWGTFEHVKDSIGLAKNCGADAVKFQFFTPQDLYGFPSHEYEAGVSPWFHHGWLAGLKQKADASGIELLCSAFSVDGLKAVDPYVSAHKLASSENNHLRMLEWLRDCGKPVLLSTGGSGKSDIGLAMATVNGLNYKSDEIQKRIAEVRPLENTRAIPLYCVSDYPAKRINLERVAELKAQYGIAGYSDHSLDAHEIPYQATRSYGACVVEKHVNFFDVQGPDAPHSLSREDFKAMCDRLRGNAVAESGQKEMTTRHNRRLIATKPIQIGEKLLEGVNFGIYRSTTDDLNGASPFMIDKYNGKEAKRLIFAGDSIGRDEV